MFKIISILLLISQCCSPNVFGSPVKDSSDPQYLEVELERLQPFVEELTKSFNHSSEPCDDYINYINGHDKGTSNFMTDANLDVLERIVMNYFKGNNDLTSSEIKVKSFLESCHDSLKDDFLDSVKNVNTNEIGYFPATNWNKDKHVLPASLGALNRIGLYIIFEFRVVMKNGKRVFFLQPTSSRSIIGDEEPKDFSRVLKHFGYTNDEISAIRTESVDFQEHLNGFDNAERYELVTFGWIKENIPEFDWAEYFYLVGIGNYKETDEIYVKKDGIKNTIELFSKCDKKTITNYIFYNIYRFFYRRHQLIIIHDRTNCIDITMMYFADVVVNILIKEYLDDHDIVNYVKVSDSILKVLKDDKIDTNFLQNHNGFMKIINDPSSIENVAENTYKNVKVSNNNFFGNILQIAYEMEKGKPLDPLLFDISIFNHLLVNHNKPRLFMMYYFIRELIPMFDEGGQKCLDMVTLQKKLKSALKTLENLKSTNEEVFNNEKSFLEKYELNQNKVLLKLVMGSLIRYSGKLTEARKLELQDLVFSLDEFFTEYKCPNEKFFKLDEKVIGEDYCIA